MYTSSNRNDLEAHNGFKKELKRELHLYGLILVESWFSFLFLPMKLAINLPYFKSFFFLNSSKLRSTHRKNAQKAMRSILLEYQKIQALSFKEFTKKNVLKGGKIIVNIIKF